MVDQKFQLKRRGNSKKYGYRYMPKRMGRRGVVAEKVELEGSHIVCGKVKNAIYCS